MTRTFDVHVLGPDSVLLLLCSVLTYNKPTVDFVSSCIITVTHNAQRGLIVPSTTQDYDVNITNFRSFYRCGLNDQNFCRKKFPKSIGMANQYDENLSRTDNIDVFTHLSHLLESNYLHNGHSHSSSRERTSVPINGRSNKSSKISSANYNGHIINYSHGDKSDGKGRFLAANLESSSTNGAISFQAWQSKIQGNENSTADKLKKIRRADVSLKSATSDSSEFPSKVDDYLNVD